MELVEKKVSDTYFVDRQYLEEKEDERKRN
jgi:hypothetical protein